MLTILSGFSRFGLPRKSILLSCFLWLITAHAFNNSPVTIKEELGSSPTLSTILQRPDFYFDPLGLATDDNFARYREAELKHGRVAMITVVWSWIAFVRSSNDNGDTGILDILQEGRLPPLFQLLQNWPWIDVFNFVAICGVLETLVLVQVDPQDMPGDYRLGYWGVRDKAKHEQSMISELENGRLAMLVMLFYLVHDVQVESESYQNTVADVMHYF